jgi:zona occludens toxin (predicted ATPase)
MRSVNMKGMRGYCMRQARREVYKAVDAYNRGRNTYTNNKPVEWTENDVWIFLGFVVGFIIFISWLIS